MGWIFDYLEGFFTALGLVVITGGLGVLKLRRAAKPKLPPINTTGNLSAYTTDD